MFAVRDYIDTDAEALSRLYEQSVRALGAHRYTPAQVEAWASVAPTGDNLAARMTDGRFRLVADAEGRPVAFIDVEPDGHVDLLYAAPEAAGTGLTATLYDAAEARLRDAGGTRLYAEASELARPFFERRGFITLARRDFEVAGVPIHNYAVEKRLDAPQET